MSNPIPTISATSPPSPHSSPSSRPNSPTRPGLRRPASHGRLAKLMLPGRSRASSSASASNEVVYADDNSPNASGRTTPEQRRRTGKAAATSLLASDARYKKLALAVDKSLASFESVNEWADFISFLSRLLKTLQSASPPFGEIPRKLIVSKRLAQCLNPALPSGVHQRALDVYAYIFSTIGVEGLRRDLLVWSSGLFPFFQAAATSVRPILISLYETHYLPLGEDLRPATKAFVLALLPGMEEETGDFFDRIYSLFAKLSDAVSPTFFLQNMFLTLISNPSSRLAVLNYLSKSLVRPPEVDQNSADVGLIMRGVAAALEDENMLVRRNGLDLLLRILHLDGNIFKEAEDKDRGLLMRAACSVVLQREVSLSRRVYTWLLGKDDSPEKQISHFRTYGLDLLVTVLQEDMECVGSEKQVVDVQKPFKIFLSLLDRWEVGAALSDRLAIPALYAIRAGLPRVAPDNREEMLDTATAVYEAVEPIIIWRNLFDALKAALGEGALDNSDLLTWLVTSIRQHDEEILHLHVPVVLEFLLQQIEVVAPANRSATCNLASILLRLIPGPQWATSMPEPDPLESVKDESSWSHKVYGEANPPLDDLRKAAIELLPSRIASMVFELNINAMSTRLSETSSLMTTLSMVSYLLNIEPRSLAHVRGRAWMGQIVRALPQVESFVVIEAMITAVLKASRLSVFSTQVDDSHSSTMSVMLDALLRYLGPQYSLYHKRAVSLLWECNQLADIHTLETATAKRMSDSRHRQEAYEAFGVLWRLTDDSMLPGEMFNIPIFMIVESLNDHDPIVRQLADSWMRSNLQSYTRILDPVLSRLLASNSDLVTTRYLFDVLSTILRTGGESVRNICKTTEMSQSLHPTIVKKAEEAPSFTYLDLMIERANSCLAIESKDQVASTKSVTEARALVRIHSSALDLLQLLSKGGTLSELHLTGIKSCLVTKLRDSIRYRQLLLQSQMLSLLETTIRLSQVTRPTHQRKRSTILEKVEHVPESEFDLALVQVIIEAVSSPQNRGVLGHWTTFILAIAPSIESRPSLILMLCECFSDQLRRVVLQLRAVQRQGDNEAVKSSIAEAEPQAMLMALERLILLVLTTSRERKQSEDPSKGQGEGGLMGLVSGVFTVEAPVNEKASDAVQYLDDVINALLLTWSATRRHADNSSQDHGHSQTRSSASSVLEKMFAANPVAVIGSCVQVWAAQSPDIEDEAIFECIDTLAPSAQKVVEIISEAVSGKPGKGSSETSSDPALMAFLEVYVARLEAPIALQVWNTLFAFARTILSTSTSTGKIQLYPTLRCVTTLCKTVSSTSALEDRRLRRDLQDVYIKLLDGVVSSVSRSSEVSSWKRESPRIGGPEAKGGDERVEQGLRDVQVYFAEQVIPNLRSFLADNDKITNAANSISAGLLVPAFRRHVVDESTLRVLLELTKLPSATKAWRLLAGEAFNDQRFFKVKLDIAAFWKPLICALMDSDKERFGELLGRITAAPSSNIFTNREQEMISRSLNLRRLTFVLLAAERNHYLAQLPSIQEKLVDILRTDVVSPRVHSEVYLCLRVLMCRISPQHLTNFWPVILTELLKVFEGAMDDPPPDNSEGLALVLAACKFLDLLLIIQSEDFQIHQWMFVTDTTDAAYPPEDFLPESIMDRLSEILSEHNHTRTNHETLALDVYENDTRALRRPRLTNVHHLTSLYQLQPFCARASIDTFEGVYGNQGVDWETVEVGLDQEVFDAREKAT